MKNCEFVPYLYCSVWYSLIIRYITRVYLQSRIFDVPLSVASQETRWLVCESESEYENFVTVNTSCFKAKRYLIQCFELVESSSSVRKAQESAKTSCCFA